MTELERDYLLEAFLTAPLGFPPLATDTATPAMLQWLTGKEHTDDDAS